MKQKKDSTEWGNDMHKITDKNSEHIKRRDKGQVRVEQKPTTAHNNYSSNAKKIITTNNWNSKLK